MYKIGIVGPSRGIEQVKEIVESYFDSVDITPIHFSSPSEIDSVKKTVQFYESYLDGIIFTNSNPYDLLNREIMSKIPWVFVEKSRNHLQKVFLEMVFTTDCDPLNISIDYFDRQAIIETYKEVGIQEENLRLFNISKLPIDNDVFDKMIQFHKINYYENKVSACITSMTVVYEKLIKDKIPCFLVAPTLDNIHNAVTQLDYKLTIQIKEQSQIVIIAIDIDTPNEYSVINENPYHMMTQKTKVTEQIYAFAQRIQAKVIESGSREYILITTRALLESITQNLEHLTLHDEISKSTNLTISMGIGYGKTAREADYNAQVGKQKARKNKGNKCYAAYDGKFIGPIVNKFSKEEAVSIIDEKFMSVAENTGVSIDTIFQLQCFIDQKKSTQFTSNELSNYMNRPLRSVNRLLSKFENAGYLTVVGKRNINSTGRPSRILELKLT